MATGTNGIATVGDLMQGKLLSNPENLLLTLCPTRTQIEGMDGIVSGSYSHNQLVKYSDIIVKLWYWITFPPWPDPWSNPDFQTIVLMEIGALPLAGISYEELHYNYQNGGMHKFERGTPLRINTEQGSPRYIYSGTQYAVHGRYTGGSYVWLGTAYHQDSDYTVNFQI